MHLKVFAKFSPIEGCNYIDATITDFLPLEVKKIRVLTKEKLIEEELEYNKNQTIFNLDIHNEDIKKIGNGFEEKYFIQFENYDIYFEKLYEHHKKPIVYITIKKRKVIKDDIQHLTNSRSILL